jgi:agmatine deiminase
MKLQRQTALEAGFRMPAEWEPHKQCWMAFPAQEEIWGAHLANSQKGYAGAARAIAGFEPVNMLAPPAALALATELCGPSVNVLPWDLDDAWMRDMGPNFLKNEQGELATSIFHFNAWGKKYEQHRKDAALGHRMAEYLGIPTFSSPLFMEGGGINVDGEGTLLTTEQCVLNANRNPGLGKEEAEKHFRDALGVEKVLWLPGDPDDRETDGHVDGIACFVKPGVVLVELCPAEGTERYENMRKNLRALEGVTDAAGRELEIVTINEAYEAERRGNKFALSYINFYIANGGIVMPAFGIERDAEAKEQLESLFPDRTVSQVNVGDVAIGGGGIHCITQQQPLGHIP